MSHGGEPNRARLITVDKETIDRLLDEAGAVQNRDILADILRNAVALASDGADRLDLKITRDALKEMREAFRMFAPYQDVRKVTIFGSARTRTDDPLYAHARELAHLLAEAGWMVVTGAGPGIMAAGVEGAGPGRALGVTIQLPFEEGLSAGLAGNDDHVVAMKYFFTRKLMLVKESSGFVGLPGGFGTQDEMFELFTLQQTGKATPAPIVLLDVPGGTYWTRWHEYVQAELVANGYVSPEDLDLFLITHDVAKAVDEIQRFWRSYRSIRWVGDRLVIRLVHAPTDAELVQLNEQFADLSDGPIERSGPLPPERSSRDALDLERLVLRFDIRKAPRLRTLIGALNTLPSLDTTS
jgi:uncharacterized protein (TIGR00730 family)